MVMFLFYFFCNIAPPGSRMKNVDLAAVGMTLTTEIHKVLYMFKSDPSQPPPTNICTPSHNTLTLTFSVTLSNFITFNKKHVWLLKVQQTRPRKGQEMLHHECVRCHRGVISQKPDRISTNRCSHSVLRRTEMDRMTKGSQEEPGLSRSSF